MANTKFNILTLEPHQKEAYNEVIKLFKEKGKAAVVFPTGCGKSFVTLKYILEHPDERFLFLSPRNAIKDQMYEYIIRYIGGDSRTIEEIQKEYGMENNAVAALRMAAKEYIPNIECMLYQTISGYGEKDSINEILEQLKPDVIIVDEMHHLKTKSIKEAGRSNIVLEDESDEIVEDDEDMNYTPDLQEQEQQNKWGGKFHKFLEDNPRARLLGLSATPLRTDGANVVERIFENSVASEISLLGAIEQGIIYPPKYVVPDFIREDELETLLQKIEQAEGSEKEQLKEKYDELVKKSANAPGIPELMQEHIEEKDGKYIVYCKDVRDMQEKMEKAKEWFGKIDEEPEVYGIHSKDKSSAKQLEQFKTSNSKHLKLMYCVGMIDEGMHLSDISGVILSAKTGSRPTYLQRIGRCISSGKDKKQALVIDLVNNNEILYDSKVQQGYEVNDLELLQELVEWVENNDGELPEFDEEKTTKEKTMAKRLARINNKYLKYVENDELIDGLDDYKRKQIEDIIALGSTIGMFEDNMELDLSEEDKKIDFFIDSFLNDIEIRGIRKEFKDLLTQKIGMSALLEKALKIEEWCKKNFENKEIWDRRLPSALSDDEEERKLGSALLALNDKKRKYKGKKIEEIENNEDRLIVEIIRRLDEEYAFGINQLHDSLGLVLKIKNWCKTNFGDKEVWERRLPYMTSTDVDEKNLGNSLHTLRAKIAQYEGIELNEIKNEDDKEIVRIVSELYKEYAFGTGQIHEALGIAKKIEKWCKTNFGDKEVWERRLPNGKSEDEEEKKLGTAFNNLKARMKKYEGIELDKIEDEDTKEIVKILRRLDKEYAFGIRQSHEALGIVLKIENWCKTKFGDKEAWERRLPYSTSIDVDEKILGTALRNFKIKIKKYEGIELNEIKNENDKEIVKIIKRLEEEYAFGIGQIHESLGIALKIENWCTKNFGDKEVWERRLPNRASKNVDESKLGAALSSLKTRMKKYEGIELEQIKDEEDREVVKIVRRLDREYAFGIRQIHESLGIALKIENWCKINFGDKEAWERRLPNRRSEDEDEKKLGTALDALRARRMKKYEGLELEQIEDEDDKKIVKILRRLDEEYNPKKVKQVALSKAKQEFDSAKQKNEDTIELEKQVEAQLNYRGKNYEEQ